MVFKKLHLGSVSFSKEALDEIVTHLENSYQEDSSKKRKSAVQPGSHFLIHFGGHSTHHHKSAGEKSNGN